MRTEWGEEIPLGFLCVLRITLFCCLQMSSPSGWTTDWGKGWLCNWNQPTLRANQMGNNSMFTRKQVGNSTLYKRPFAILQRAPHDLFSLGFSLELCEELHTHALICKLKRKEQEPCFLSYCTLHKALIASNSLHGFDFITLKWVVFMTSVHLGICWERYTGRFSVQKGHHCEKEK